MRQHTPKWIAACAGMLLTVSCIGGLSASATTVDDVIAHAYAVGLPDETIQQCINQYSSGQYTSEQCDAAIAELDAWAADRNAAVSSAIADGGKTTTPANNNGNNNNGNAGAETAAPNTPSSSTTTTIAFANMTPEQKQDYVSGMTQQEQKEFLENMSNEDRNSYLKDLGLSDKADMLQGFLNIGESLGMNFSIDTIDDDTIIVSARDADGNLKDVMTFGNEVEATGKPYTVPVLLASGMIVLAVGGLGALLYCAKKQK